MKRTSLFRTLLTAAAVAIFGVSSLCAMADGIWESSTSRSDDGNICIDFEEIQVVLPSSWSGKCQMETTGATVSFYQIKSRELWSEELGFDNGGWLFSITCTQDEDYLDLPDYQTLGTGTEGIYFASFPTDVQAYTDDADASKEYNEMAVDMEWVKQHITVKTDDFTSIVTADGDYILPESSTSYLTADDLDGLTEAEVQMAINEIYARHHRRFLLQEVQDYFDAKDWYEGTIEPDDFDVSVMNSYEGTNIDLMTRQLKTLQGSN